VHTILENRRIERKKPKRPSERSEPSVSQFVGMAELNALQDESSLKVHFLTMKKMKNSHPHIPHLPHVPQVQPVGQDPQAPFRHGIHKGENTQRVLRHPLKRPTCYSGYKFKRTEFFA
jgi:hypothetical protein